VARSPHRGSYFRLGGNHTYQYLGGHCALINLRRTLCPRDRAISRLSAPDPPCGGGATRRLARAGRRRPGGTVWSNRRRRRALPDDGDLVCVLFQFSFGNCNWPEGSVCWVITGSFDGTADGMMHRCIRLDSNFTDAATLWRAHMVLLTRAPLSADGAVSESSGASGRNAGKPMVAHHTLVPACTIRGEPIGSGPRSPLQSPRTSWTHP
jgi:hypothetical protein